MRSLPPEVMRHIVDSGESFLLVDVRPADSKGRSLPNATRMSLNDDLISKVRAQASQLTLPIVIYGDGEGCPVAEKAAAVLSQAGFAEVWTYFGHPEAWAQRQPDCSKPQYVVCDPDLVWSDSRTNQQTQWQEAY